MSFGFPKPIRRRPKFGRGKIAHAKPQMYGITFDSGLERDLYLLSRDEMEKGLISQIQIKDHVYMTLARILLIVDYKITKPNGEFVWRESKGFEDEKWRIKRRLWQHYGPGPLEVWKRQGKQGLRLHETIHPREAK